MQYHKIVITKCAHNGCKPIDVLRTNRKKNNSAPHFSTISKTHHFLSITTLSLIKLSLCQLRAGVKKNNNRSRGARQRLLCVIEVTAAAQRREPQSLSSSYHQPGFWVKVAPAVL